MVSFSCEACGDVVTKKKLDGHRNQCRDASFTCLDCMVHFKGTDYRSHTSCITEAEKYEGKAPREKSKRKSVTITLPEEMYNDTNGEWVDEPNSALALVDAPPPVPSPPPSAPAQPVNVFDFLVAEDTPNGTKMSVASPKDHHQITYTKEKHSQKTEQPSQSEPMRMVKDAPPLFKSLSSSPEDQPSGSHFPAHLSAHPEAQRSATYSAKGYAYGAEPVAASGFVSGPSPSFQTPAPKPSRSKSNHQHTSSTDKKRKRQVEELDLSRASRSSQELDEEMLDADAAPVDHNSATPSLHSGLTGGLNRLMSASHNFPPSPDYSGEGDADPSPLSPAKRKYVVANGSVVADKRGRRRLVAAGTGQGQLLKARKVRRSSDESRPRKHHRHERSERSERGGDRNDRGRADKSERGDHPDRLDRVKAIDFPTERSVSPGDHNQVVVYRSRAELFLSMVGKGPESESGYSVNKALKRYHRERLTSGAGRTEKGEEEKELWRSLRLKRNERGEVVVFVGGENGRDS